jgi:branched-subunit amino acid transport protein
LADAWTVVILVVVTTALIRASGPVLLGGRELPQRATGVVALLAPALLAALVMTETFRGEGSSLTLDERAIGVAGAGAVMAMRGPLLLALPVAMGLTAAARAAV